MKLSEVIVITASYYGKVISEQLLKMYLEDLSDLSDDEAIAAYRQYRKNPKNRFFPLPAQILEIARPEVSEQSLAVDASAKILQAITNYGSWNSAEAKIFVGEQGWGAVQRMGGWSYLCENVGVSIQPTAFVAQARELIKSGFDISRSDSSAAKNLLPYRTEPFEIEEEKKKQILALIKNQTPEGSNV